MGPLESFLWVLSRAGKKREFPGLVAVYITPNFLDRTWKVQAPRGKKRVMGLCRQPLRVPVNSLKVHEGLFIRIGG